ncbi:WD40 repeat-like protein [Auricularia subglabra TFB-10046 SS5]|nr:WD40 repeat-like protein [Auricularia subglabra TFB-10046 SS5]
MQLDDDEDADHQHDEDEDDMEEEQDSAANTVVVNLQDLINRTAAGGTTGSVGFLEMLRFARALGLSLTTEGGGISVSGAGASATPRTRDSAPPSPFAAHKEPQQAGVHLLNSGEFGSVRMALHLAKDDRNLVRRLRQRESVQRREHGRVEELVRPLVPNANGTVTAMFTDNVYSGQYSEDGQFFYTCCRDFRLDIFSTTEPADPFASSGRLGRRGIHSTSQSTMKNVGSIRGSGEGWTVTDSHLSPDNERLIYASMSRTVYLTHTGLTAGFNASADVGEPQQTPVRFHAGSGRRRSVWAEDDDVQIWSCRFSADGNEIVAGGNTHIFVYDLLADKQAVQIPAHEWDINSCCWADTASGNVLISASDDTFVKVWDRRSLGSGKPSGVLIGHVEGITYVAPKGDGRYVISNGKDQTLRLWDLRMMKSHEDYVNCRRQSYGDNNFDYRYGVLPRLRHKDHPLDCSVMQYRGHEVLRTLIRCNFSPAETTGQSYIYSGGSNGMIHVWSLDGRVVQVIDRSHTLPISLDPSGVDPEELPPRQEPISRPGRRPTGIVVRDVSWHPQQPVLLSSAWESQTMKSNVARHEWKGLSKHARTRPRALEDLVEVQLEESRERKRRRLRIPGEYYESDESL